VFLDGVTQVYSILVRALRNGVVTGDRLKTSILGDCALKCQHDGSVKNIIATYYKTIFHESLYSLFNVDCYGHGGYSSRKLVAISEPKANYKGEMHLPL
jgi:hypothetical protein